MSAAAPTRRGFLATAAIGAPLACAMAAPAALAGRDAWDAALARYQHTAEALNDHPYNDTIPGSPDYDRLDEDNAACVQEATAACDDLLDMPAPDHKALIDKLRIYTDEYGDPSSNGVLATVIADVGRLTWEGR